MDQVSLVDRRIEDGQKLVQQLAHDHFDVTAAFWLRTGEDDWWHLYVASKVFDERGPLEAYGILLRSLQRLSGTTVSLTDIKLIGASSPMANDVLKIRSLYSGTEPIPFGGSYFGGSPVEEAVIYPPAPRAEDPLPSKA